MSMPCIHTPPPAFLHATGNYGVPDTSAEDEFGLPAFFESTKIHVAGLVVSEYSEKYSHWNAKGSLGAWLASQGIPAISGVDTRHLTKRIREEGAMLGFLAGHCPKGAPAHTVQFQDPNTTNLVAKVSRTQPLVLNKGAEPRIVAFDCGIKANIIRCLAKLGVEVTVVPFDWDFDKDPTCVDAEGGKMFTYDGVFLSNGPGDPAMAKPTIATLRHLIKPALDLTAAAPTVVSSALHADSGAGTGEAAAPQPPAGDASSAAGAAPGARFCQAADLPTVGGEAIAAALLKRTRPIPVFGICLGNQLMALAAGASTYKLKYGNRGMNQPCVDMRTTRCYITPQNHGFAVDGEHLPAGWIPLFVNANDSTNEGITHSTLPYFSVQFHPEASGGPLDTSFLFHDFLNKVKGTPSPLSTVDSSILRARHTLGRIRKVLLLGSGGLSIGQAGEFDYSGSQAIKALKEEGLYVVLVNPNIATVQTSSGMADKTYFLPLTPEFVRDVIVKEAPDGIIVSMGGQTALNVGVALHRGGVLAQHNVQVLGTPIDVIEDTEDREVFAKIMESIGEHVARSESATTLDEAIQVAERIGYPVLVRAAFALGGLGSGFAENRTELIPLLEKALAHSPQVLIDQDLRGWKEVEYEVVRDAADNCITVCNMENFDPLGVHTGDSIVVAPSQTLSNSEYFKLRATALKVVRRLGVVGECNIQYALHPESERFCIIEVNARLSRSSALASKATGYPLAYVAAKLALGHDLVSLRNSVTKTTTACFEPSLDYCVVKMPRWDLKKFSQVSNKIGSQMKSVGEVMSIGRSFEEAMQKAIRMVNPALAGFHASGSELRGEESQSPVLSLPTLASVASPMLSATQVPPSTSALSWADAALPAAAGPGAGQAAADAGAVSKPANPTPQVAAPTAATSSTVPASSSSQARADGDATSAAKRPRRASGAAGKSPSGGVDTERLDELLTKPSDTRLLDIAVAFSIGYTVDAVHALTKIDHWFLFKLKRIADMTRTLATVGDLSAITKPVMKELKKAGFADKQIALCLGSGVSEVAVRRHRVSQGIVPRVKQIDTLAAEFPAHTNYLYMTYNGDAEDDIAPSQDGTIVLGCGPYCIGSSVEFDWCAVSCLRALREAGRTAIVINYNPETVSTDYDESDRLYFDELSLERVLDVYEREAAAGVVVSVGGQIPNTLAMPLHEQGVKILGTSPTDIDRAEDRNKFSQLCDRLRIDQPRWAELSSPSDIKAFVGEVGFPVLVRPSYVLSGAAMRVVSTEAALHQCLQDAKDVSPDAPVVVSQFIENAKEVEFDAVAKDGRILNYAISEHVENAGVHSGDATLVLPAQKLYVETIRRVKLASAAIARELNISGPFNIQYMSRNNEVMVIECNLRASRTFPFVSKTFNTDFIALATRVMVGVPAKPASISLVDLDYVAVKAPMFSFTRLQGADPTLGVEMMSTGEVACFGRDVHEAFLKALLSARFRLPTRSKAVLLSIGGLEAKAAILDACQKLVASGLSLFATEGTAAFLGEHGVPVTLAHKPTSGLHPNTTDLISEHKVDLVINDPQGGLGEGVSNGYRIRRAAVDYDVSLITNLKCAIMLANALHSVKHLPIKDIHAYHSLDSGFA